MGDVEKQKQSTGQKEVKSSLIDDHVSKSFDYFDEKKATNMLAEFYFMWKQSLFTDVTVIIDSQKFVCHRTILAASSPYFKALFYHSHKSREDTELHLSGIPAKGFEILLGFFYTGFLNLTPENVVDTLEAADFLQYRNITEICFSLLRQYLDVSNCLSIASIAEAHLCQSLSFEAKEYAAANIESVMLTEDFLELPPNLLSDILAGDSILRVDEEKNILQGLCKWVQHKVSERRNLSSKMMHYIKLHSIKKEDISEIVNEFSHLKIPELFNIDNMSCPKCPPTRKQGNMLSSKAECFADSSGCEVEDIKRRPSQTLVFIPGDASKKGTNIMWYFHPQTQNWQTLANLPFMLRCLYTSSVLKNNIYICGGEEFEIPFNEVYTFNIYRKEWKGICPMLKPRAYHSACVTGGQLYVIGGKEANGLDLRKDGEIFNPVTKQWTIIPDILQVAGIGRCAFVPLDGKLYIFGGTCNTHSNLMHKASRQFYKGAQYYDLMKNAWFQATSLSECIESEKIRVGNGDGFSYHGLLLIIDEDPRGKRMKLYNPVSGKMSEFAKTHGQHRFGGYSIMNETLYCTGGVLEQFKSHDLVHFRKLCEPDSAWQMMTPLPMSSSHHTCSKVFMIL